MVPNTTATVVAFLFFVTPGLLYEILAERQRPPRPGSTFREISSVGLLSVVCSTAAALVLALVRARKPAWILDPGAWLRDGRKYLTGVHTARITKPSHYALVVRTLAIEVTLACLFALALYWLFIGRHARETRTDPHPVLWSITGGRGSTPSYRRDAKLFALARTHEGDVYMGRFLAIDLEADRSPAMLALQPDIMFQRNEQPPGALPPEWDRLAIPMENVQELWLRWVKGEPKPPKKRFWQKKGAPSS